MVCYLFLCILKLSLVGRSNFFRGFGGFLELALLDFASALFYVFWVHHHQRKRLPTYTEVPPRSVIGKQHRKHDFKVLRTLGYFLCIRSFFVCEFLDRQRPHSQLGNFFKQDAPIKLCWFGVICVIFTTTINFTWLITWPCHEWKEFPSVLRVLVIMPLL